MKWAIDLDGRIFLTSAMEGYDEPQLCLQTPNGRIVLGPVRQSVEYLMKNLPSLITES